MKKMIKRSTAFLFFAFSLTFSVNAQIVTEKINHTGVSLENSAMFFTNRPLVISKDSTYSFKNSSTKKTNTLYFCDYNFVTDSIEINYKVQNLSDDYPTGPIENNIFYEMYEYMRLQRGIKIFYFVVGGYGKSFKKQVHSYMKRLKTNYGDTLLNNASITTFAWGTEEDAYQYYNAVRKSKNGAADFAIFQHMLEDFLSDSVYFQTHPKDFIINILFSSMGNNLFREYLERRENQDIPLMKVYNNISFVGSVAPRNSFQKGKAFYHLHQMTDTVNVFVNSKDVLLKFSSAAHLKSRMGNKGPKNEDELPRYIKVFHIENIITKQDMSGLGHDYLLTNPVLREEIIENVSHKLDGKNE